MLFDVGVSESLTVKVLVQPEGGAQADQLLLTIALDASLKILFWIRVVYGRIYSYIDRLQ